MMTDIVHNSIVKIRYRKWNMYVQFAVYITKKNLASFTFANVPVKLVFSVKCKFNLIEDQVNYTTNF